MSKQPSAEKTTGVTSGGITHTHMEPKHHIPIQNHIQSPWTKLCQQCGANSPSLVEDDANSPLHQATQCTLSRHLSSTSRYVEAPLATDSRSHSEDWCSSSLATTHARLRTAYMPCNPRSDHT